MKILIVLTSHDQLGDTGKPTGFWLEEFAAPYYVFKDAGADIVLASPKGGQPPLDPKSDAPDAQTEMTKRFKNDAEGQALLANTCKLDEVSAVNFDAVFYPGGHGPLWDLANSVKSRSIIEQTIRAGHAVRQLPVQRIGEVGPRALAVGRGQPAAALRRLALRSGRKQLLARAVTPLLAPSGRRRACQWLGSC